MIHGIFAVALLWLNAVRMFSIFNAEDAFNMLTLNKIIVVSWSIQCAVSQTAFYASSHLRTLQKTFAKMKLTDSCAFYLRRMAIVYTIAAWSVVVIGVAFFVYSVFFTDGSKDFAITPFTTHVTVSSKLIVIPRIVMFCLSFYMLAAHTFPQVMTYLLATLFSYRFKNLEKELDECLDSTEGGVGDSEIEAIRQKHQEIAMSVSHVDDCLMFHNASAFCCQLCCFIILLFMLIFYHSDMDDPVIITGNVWWMLLLTLGLVFTAAGGIQINHYVSRPVMHCTALMYYA